MSHPNAERRSLAQQFVHQHVNRRRGNPGAIDWNFIHVVHIKALGSGNWMAVVLVSVQNQMVYQVIYDSAANEYLVETFTRQGEGHVYEGTESAKEVRSPG